MQILSAGQKAAATRAANQANGSSAKTSAGKPKVPASVIGEARLSALNLALVIVPEGSKITLSFHATREGTTESYETGLGTGERGLTDLRWMGVLSPETGEWTASGASASTSFRTAEFVRDLGILMVQADATLLKAIEDSEDDTFAFVVAQLASMFRVTRVLVRQDGKETEHKRGAAYLTTLRLTDAIAAKFPAKAPEPVKAPAIAQVSEPAKVPVTVQAPPVTIKKAA